MDNHATEERLKGQREIIQGYYLRIHYQKPDLETIMDWLEDDLRTLGMEDTLLGANKVLESPKDNIPVDEAPKSECNVIKCENTSVVGTRYCQHHIDEYYKSIKKQI